MTEFLEAAQAVRAEHAGHNYIRSIKELAAKELKRIDPLARLEDTQYFNHSAIPDFILTWSGDRDSRDVYLRSSYASIVAARDIKRNDDASSMFLVLDDRTTFDDEFPRIGPAEIAKEARKASSALLTDAGALGEIAESGVDAGSSPIAGLVRQNFVRAARGWIDEPRAADLVTSAVAREPGASIADLVRESFDPDAALKLERTAALMDEVLSLTRDEEFPELSAVSGSLSASELSNLLPWLLENMAPDAAPAFWARFAQLVEFRELKKAASVIDQKDITALIMANIDKWTSRWAYLGLGVDEVDAPTWMFRGGNLCFQVGADRITFSDDGRAFKGRDSSIVPRWSDLSAPLQSFKLSSVSMSGVTRSVRIDAGESPNIRADVERVTESLEDSYQVSKVAVTFEDPNDEEATVEVDVDFGKSVALGTPYCSLRGLSDTAMSLLSFRSPVAGGSLEAAFPPSAPLN